jgi:hypothetical protein
MCVIITSKNMCAQGKSRSSPLEARTRLLTPWQMRLHRILSVIITKPYVWTVTQDTVVRECEIYVTLRHLHYSRPRIRGHVFGPNPQSAESRYPFLISLCDSNINVSDLPAQRLKEHSIVKFSDSTSLNHSQATIFVQYVIVSHTLDFSNATSSPVSWASCTP